MEIEAKHIKSERRVGTLHGKPVVEVVTYGGLNMIVVEKAGKVETIGAGPHRAVSRYIAQKNEPDLIITELSKSDYVSIESILSVLPRYEDLTRKLNELMRG